MSSSVTVSSPDTVAYAAPSPTPNAALLWLLLAAALVVLLDQGSKAWVLGRARRRSPADKCDGSTRPVAAIVVGLRLHVPLRALFALWVALTALMLFAAAMIPSLGAMPVRFASGIALGGAASNLFDIRRRGAVVDFIDLRVWPVFNLADVAIVLGVTVVLLRVAPW